MNSFVRKYATKSETKKLSRSIRKGYNDYNIHSLTTSDIEYGLNSGIYIQIAFVGKADQAI